MKKFVLIALVLVIAVTFAFAAFQAPTAGADAFAGRGKFCPKVGWNSSAACMVDAPSLQSIARGGKFTPDVGWNS